jgi:uncharacterized membrane protein
MPVHPALVHLPLGLALLMPVGGAVAAWMLWSGRIQRRGWTVVIALQALLLASGIVALKSGERDEDLAERVVAEGALHQHEALAEQFVVATGVVLALSLLVLVPSATVTRGSAVAMAAGSVIVAGLALRVGHAGGQLVYVHGAAGPYVAQAGGGPTTPAEVRAPRERNDH